MNFPVIPIIVEFKQFLVASFSIYENKEKLLITVKRYSEEEWGNNIETNKRFTQNTIQNNARPPDHQ